MLKSSEIHLNTEVPSLTLGLDTQCSYTEQQLSGHPFIICYVYPTKQHLPNNILQQEGFGLLYPDSTNGSQVFRLTWMWQVLPMLLAGHSPSKDHYLSAIQISSVGKGSHTGPKTVPLLWSCLFYTAIRLKTILQDALKQRQVLSGVIFFSS